MRGMSLEGIMQLPHLASFLVQSLPDTLHRRGLVSTATIAFSLLVDLTFDWRHGTKTIAPAELDRLHVPSPNKFHGVRYQATRARPFRRLLRELALPTGGTFVDLGSGKGRVLLLAAQAGFSR